MFDRETWTFINGFAAWVSAFGTLAAAIIALYLSRQESRVRLAVVAGVRIIVQQGAGERLEYLCVEVTNIGRRPAQITNLYWRDGYPRGAQFVWIAPRNALSSTVPVILTDGQRANYFVLMSEFFDANGDLAPHFKGPRGRIRACLYRVGVSTSAGPRFEARLEKGLRDRLLKFAGDA